MIHHGENLRRLLRNRGIKLYEFADKLKITRPYFSTLLDRKKISDKYIPKIKKELGTDLNYETTDYGTSSIKGPRSEYFSPEKGNIIFVPLYAYGGFLTGYASNIFMDTLKRFFLPGVTGEHFAFEVDGMSMYDFASPGDWAISRPQETGDHFVKGRAYVLQTIDGILIKYFDSIEGSDDSAKATFISHNKDFTEKIKIPLKSIKKAYFVTRILKKI